METRPQQINEALGAMVRALNAKSENLTGPTLDRRAERRRVSCARCDLWVFDGAGEKTKIANVVTRNVSFCGVSVVAKLPGPVSAGCAIEAVVALANGSGQHAAGVIAFCRDMEAGYYEIGIAVKAVGSHTILTDDTADSIARYEWFARTLQGPEQHATGRSPRWIPGRKR